MIDDDNPEWTDADFARAKPASEALPAAVFDGLVKRAPLQPPRTGAVSAHAAGRCGQA